MDTIGCQIDVRQWVNLLTLEGIGEGGFGYSFQTFNEKDDNRDSLKYRALIKEAS